ncbi:hypothetical protein SNE26_09495 [Mucilaginibacter sp. cycad4]|uniref:hypothetical protein n=1 Tax=Mucilaginibacter sp. cycad4 TaxID=3342096 RepID=UPI002AAB690E|nr:hypothetical protein [Mucilaginibacter gossypii]WPV02008.1 hypothetical protein SNE26_09495 [Mucilaginibacter gossypii]
MKKFKIILLAFFCMGAAMCVRAQTKDYYPGKWNVIVLGTPNGDAKMILVIDRKDGKLSGTVQDSTGKETAKITRMDEKDKTVAIAFISQGYDVSLTLEPVDEDHVKGALMGMFEAKGIRKKEN